VLWPLLTPLGDWFANMDAGGIHLPWASIAGFADVLELMALVVCLASKHQRRRPGPRRRRLARPPAAPG
jgi:hypothetical protein